MNRKERRAAQKPGNLPRASATPIEHRGPAAGFDQGYVLAAQHYGAGQLAEAEHLCRQILGANPKHVDGLHLLGMIAHRAGKNDIAIDLLQRAIGLKPSFAEAQYNLGTVLAQDGRLDEAAARYRRALKHRPDFAAAHYNLGNALREQGKPADAAECYRRAVALMPDNAEAHNNLGRVLMAQGHLEKAIACFQSALTLKPDLVEGHHNLFEAYLSQGDQPRALGAINNVCKAFLSRGDLVRALDAIKPILDLVGSAEAKALFVQCVKDVRLVAESADLSAFVVRALSESWGRPKDLAWISIALVKRNSVIDKGIDLAMKAWPARVRTNELLGSGGLATLGDDDLLRALLQSTPACDVGLERFLAGVRVAMLEAATGTAQGAVEGKVLNFCCALARQCFINEYLFGHTEEELAQASALRDALADALQSESAIPALWPVAVAAYFPLHSLPNALALRNRLWPSAVNELLVQQIDEPRAEQQYRTSIPQLTKIDDEISLLVRQQYEENPYPRWMKPGPVDAPSTIETYLRRLFPLAPLRDLGTGSGTDVLIAGCRTGQQSVETARQLTGARVLAVDLSLASLCYAKRKSRELGLTNVEYAQADILQLASIGRTFDVIEASGVLHHLADPMAGWTTLLALLRPDGFMRLGFYSEIARREIIAAVQRFFGGRDLRSTADDIRRRRDQLISLDEASPLRKVVESPDFFSISECRDLLFHVQEHRLRLPEIKTFLAENSLELLGFQVDPHVLRQFRSRFPSDDAMTNLDRWNVFEIENPNTFIGMYQFWVQRN